MVALRLEHEDLKDVGYSTIYLPLITVLLARERVHKLEEALEHFAPENLRTRRRKTLLDKKNKASDDVKPVMK